MPRHRRNSPRLRQLAALLVTLAPAIVLFTAGCSPPQEPAPPTPEWAEVLDWRPDPAIVPDADHRARIEHDGMPWRVRHLDSGVELLWVPAGSYRRGAGSDDPYDRENERPAHEAQVTAGFYLGRYEVTNAQMRRFRPEHDSGAFYRAPELTLNDDTMPAVDVSWNDAQAFGRSYGMRLPTEAEWEYAARAGVETRYPWGNDIAGGEGWGNVFDAGTQAQIPAMDWEAFAWDDGFRVSSPVGSFRPNAWGFFDMFGNAWEWCYDGFHDDAYGAWADGAADPARQDGSRRTLRGGGWGNAPRGSGIPYRFGMQNEDRFDGNGFRVALTPLDSLPPEAPIHFERDTDAPSWSRDGSRIAYEESVDGDWEIFVMDADGSSPVRLTFNQGRDTAPAWSPDGEWLAFASEREGVRDIYRMRADGSDLRRITSGDGPEARPSWAPDGRRLVFNAVSADGTREIYTIAVDGTDLRQITDDENHSDWAWWTADGRWIHFESDRTGRWETYVMRPDGSEVRQTSRDGGSAPVPSPDGRLVAGHARREGNWEIVVWDAEANERNLTAHPTEDRMPAWSPDGTSVTHISRRAGALDIYSTPLEGGEPRRLTFQPPGALDLFGLVQREGAASARGLLEELRERYPAGRMLPERKVNRLGYELLGTGDLEAAVDVFELNVELYPDSGNVHDSLGEALLAAGQRERAEISYRRSLELDPGNDNARRVLDEMAAERAAPE